MSVITILRKRKIIPVGDLVGAIILWYGISANVPEGYEIYAPAKDAFVMGAEAGGLNTTPTGSNTHQHSWNQQQTGTAPNHTHDIEVPVAIAEEGPLSTHAGVGSGTIHLEHTHTTNDVSSAAGSHVHGLNNIASQSHSPPHHRLYWIRRVA